MFSTIIQPRSDDTNGLGNIYHAALASWFETARNTLFKIFTPDLSIKVESLPLIVAHTDYDFENELVLKHEVEIRTWVTHIGTKSFTVYHEAWQKQRLCVKGTAVIVHYNFKTKQSTSMPKNKKRQLEIHLRPDV
jgi:acyl-CoA thioester hydrolase